MIELRDYADDELRALQPVEIAPGITDANGTTRGRHLQNPFRDVISDPRGMELAARWSRIHWGGDNGPAVAQDPFDLLREALDPQRLFSEVRAEDGSLVGANPVTAGDTGMWEAGCLQMHQSQESIGLAEEKAPPRFEDVLKRGD